MNAVTIERTLRRYGWQDRPAVEAAEQLSGMCRAGAVNRQQSDAVLTDIVDAYAAHRADQGCTSRTINPREAERIVAALGW